MHLKQPKAFYLIALTEVWERFGYYGVTALIVVYMVNQLGYTDNQADLMFGGFSALVFLLPALGGYIGDQYFGTKRTILLGACILALGYALLAIPSLAQHKIYLPLAVICVGNGFFKPNPSSLIAKLYKNTQISRDSTYTLFYMSINVGSLLSMLATPLIQKHYGYTWAYITCFFGLTLAILAFVSLRTWLESYGSEPDRSTFSIMKLFLLLTGSIIAVLLCAWLLAHVTLLSKLLAVGTVITLLFYFNCMYKAKPYERIGMWLFIFLFFEAILFWVLYFQMPTLMTLFAVRNVQHTLFGISVQPQSVQALNPLAIIILSPLLASLYNRLHAKQADLTMPLKFTIGILLCSTAYFVLFFGCYYYAVNGIINSLWIVAYYTLQSSGELLVSALGLSLAARYISQSIMGFVMGLWFLSSSIAAILGGYLSSFATIPKSLAHDPIRSMPIYYHLFAQIGFVTLIIGLIMALFIYPLNKLVYRYEHQKNLNKSTLS